MEQKAKFKIKLTYTQIIALSFVGVIVVGGLLLMLPFASTEHCWTDPLTSFFTATSATCVTGLVMVDTYTYWSVFGHMIILILIQIGGLGFMTVMTAFFILMRKKIGLRERSLLMQSTGSISHGGIIRLIRRIVIGTVVFEVAGAILLSIRFIPKMGPLRGIWNAVFHSVSAFCNAGFDLMGKYGEFSSLTGYSNDVFVTLIISGLVIVGGIGFLVWDDIIRHGIHIKRYELHTKIVLSTTVILLLAGWGLFYLFEYNGVLSALTPQGKTVASFFMSVTPRTAGFNTVDMSHISDSSTVLTIIFMFIGGSPGSTAGGVKTATVAVLLLQTFAAATNRNNITVFKRRLDDGMVKKASAIITVYFTAIIIAVMIMCQLEPFGLKEILFDAVSAIGTVGLTLGITPMLGNVSHIILMFLMFTGRVGGLSLVLILGEKSRSNMSERPKENILIG